MLKKVFFAACAVALVTGATATAPVTAQAATTCKELAKAKYPDSIRERISYKRACRKAGKEGLLTRFKIKS